MLIDIGRVTVVVDGYTDRNISFWFVLRLAVVLDRELTDVAIHHGGGSHRKYVPEEAFSTYTRVPSPPHPFPITKANPYSTANLLVRHPHKPRILLNKGLPLVPVPPHIRRPSFPTCKLHLPSLRTPKLPRANPHLDLPMRSRTQSLRRKQSR